MGDGLRTALAMSAPELLAVIHTLQRMSAGALRWWDDYDVLVTPTTAGPASPLGDYLRTYVSGLGSAFTRPINVTGQPAISLPLGWPDDGLPRGVQLVGGYGREDTLIRLSARLEEALPWSHRIPEVATMSTYVTGRWTSPAGLGLAYRESGRRDGPPLLFLHGLSASSATYDEARTSVDATHRVFSLDFRGHGGSDRAPGTYQVPNYGADVAAFIEWIGQPVALAGHSLGGAVATYLAGARPDLVAGALLEDPPLYHGDREFFATTIFPKIFEMIRDTMRRLHDEGAGRDEVRADAPRPTDGDRR